MTWYTIWAFLPFVPNSTSVSFIWRHPHIILAVNDITAIQKTFRLSENAMENAFMLFCSDFRELFLKGAVDFNELNAVCLWGIMSPEENQYQLKSQSNLFCLEAHQARFSFQETCHCEDFPEKRWKLSLSDPFCKVFRHLEKQSQTVGGKKKKKRKTLTFLYTFPWG